MISASGREVYLCLGAVLVGVRGKNYGSNGVELKFRLSKVSNH